MRDARSIVSHCRQGGTLLKQFTAYASGRGGVRFSLQPSDEHVPTHCAELAIASGWLRPLGRDLFGDPTNAQTWSYARNSSTEHTGGAARARVSGTPQRVATDGGAQPVARHDKHHEEINMDMRQFGGGHYAAAADVRDGPIAQVIADVRTGKYDKPDLHFESGDILSLNATNRRVLIRASETWTGMHVELVLGEVEFQKEAVIVKLISPAITAVEQAAAAEPKPVNGSGGDMDDDIPF